jgi:hypothetical protein
MLSVENVNVLGHRALGLLEVPDDIGNCHR